MNAYFGPTIYKQLGYSGTTILLISGISGAWGMICTFIFISKPRRGPRSTFRCLHVPPLTMMTLLSALPAFLVDRLGRRPPLVYGGFLMACALSWQSGVGSLFRPGRDYKSDSAGIAGQSLPAYLEDLSEFVTTQSHFLLLQVSLRSLSSPGSLPRRTDPSRGSTSQRSSPCTFERWERPSAPCRTVSPHVPSCLSLRLCFSADARPDLTLAQHRGDERFAITNLTYRS